MDRTSRTLKLREALLADEESLNALAWAERFEVDLRTIQRDIAYLRAQGEFSIIFDQRAGGYRLARPKQPEMTPRVNKSARMFEIIQRIAAEPGLTAQQLAESLGRDKRTIYRDIRALEDLGFPLYTDNGYRLAADAMLPTLHLQPTEFLALLLGARMVESQGPSSLGADARCALEKITRGISEPRRPNIGALRSNIQLSGPSEETGFETMVALQTVIGNGYQLRIDYQGIQDSATATRQIDPMGIFSFRQVWYLRGFDHNRSAHRSYRISRIVGWEVTDTPVVHNPQMELGEAVYNRWDLAGGSQVTVELRVSDALGRWLTENPPHPSQQVAGDRVTYQVSDLDAVARWTASLYGLEVLSPPELRERLERMGNQLLATYGEGAPAIPGHLAFQRDLQQAFAETETETGTASHPLVLAMLDLDNFRAYNEHLGYDAGEILLRDFIALVSEIAPPTAKLYRYGGDEFALLCADSHKEDVLKICEAIRAATLARWAAAPIQVTVSVGIACYPIDADSARDLAKATDHALYVAKRGGRNRVCASPDLTQRRNSPITTSILERPRKPEEPDEENPWEHPHTSPRKPPPKDVPGPYRRNFPETPGS